MSITIPRIINSDRQLDASKDFAINTKIRIKNITRATKENAQSWKESQKRLYGNVLDVSPDTDLEQLIKIEGLASDDVDNNRAIALQNLTKIANEEIANYIVDRLSSKEIAFLTTYFKKVIIEIKKIMKNIDKDVFVNVVKEFSDGSLNVYDKSEITEDAVDREIIKQQSSETLSKKLNNKDLKYNLREGNVIREDNNKKRIEMMNIASGKITKARMKIAQKRTEGEDAYQASRAQARAKKQQMIDDRALLRQDAPPNRIVENPILSPKSKTPKKIRKDGFQLGSSSSFGSPAQPNEEFEFFDTLSSPSERVSEREEEFDFFKLVGGVAYNQLMHKNYGKTNKGTKRKQPTKTQKEHIKAGDEAMRKDEMEGLGLNKKKKKKVIYGRGCSLKSQQNRHSFGIYYLDKKKLNENILTVKYTKTDSPIQKLRTQKISNELKEIINDVITNKFNNRIYNGLNETDKRLFNRFIETVKLTDSIPIDNTLDDNFQKNYQVLIGEFQSGNNSPEIKDALKRFVVEGLGMGIINRSESLFLLYQLSL